MRKLQLEEVKKIQMSILDFVATFCDNNGIQYWVDSGTLIGAIRHKGYIPWDDDIDIGMLREDYNKFSKMFNCNNDRYKFVCLENTPGFYLPHGKVCDTSTVLYEPDEAGYKLSVNIDVFVYDNAPDSDSELKKMYDVRDRLRKIHTIQNLPVYDSGSLLKNCLKHIRKIFYKTFYPKDCIERMILNAKKHSLSETTRVGNFTACTRMACNKRVFDSFIDVEFEGKKYKAPVGYDEWLTSFYGDYMALPPKEKQVSHHRYMAYVCDQNDKG